MPLSDAKIRTLRATDKPYKVADFDGLFLLVKSSGTKSWRFKYRFAGREKLMVFGDFPAFTLAHARLARDAACFQAAILEPTTHDPLLQERALCFKKLDYG